MRDMHHHSPSPRPSDALPSNGVSHRTLGHRAGVILTLVGDLLVVGSLFVPWLELLKPGVPDVPGTGEYSPWTVVLRGRLDALGVVVVISFLVTLAMVLSTLVLAHGLVDTHSASAHTITSYIAAGSALAGAVAIGVVVAGLPTGFALTYPYYDTNILFGAWLAFAGFVCVLVGAAGDIIG